jgi:tetratricopeptide (TPR) repeat protein
VSRNRLKRLALIAVGTSVVLAGTAAAYLVLNRRDVTTSSAEAYRHYRRGRENELKLYEKEAMAEYAEALGYDGHFVMATLRLAGILAKRDPEHAKSLVESVRQYQDQITARERFELRIFGAYMARKDAKEIEALLDECVRAFPKDSEPYRQRAMFYLSHERPADGIKDMERVIAINPNDAVAYNSLGYYWAAMGDYAKAEDYFKRYRFLAPDQANPYDSLGELYVNTGRYEEAEASLKKALQVKPDFVHSVAEMGTLEIARGNPAAAATHYRRAAEMSDSVGARVEFGAYEALSLLDAGRSEEAAEKFQKVAAEVEGTAGEEGKRLARYAAIYRSVFDMRVGRLDQAEADLADAMARGADLKGDEKTNWEKDGRFIRGLIARRRGRDEEAVSLLASSFADRKISLAGFQLYPTISEGHIALADSLRRLGRTKEAEEALQVVLRRNPKFQPAMAVQAALRGTAPVPAAGR